VSNISEPYLWSEQAAHAKLEDIVWPRGPVCPHCGATDRIGAVIGKGARVGLKFCCRCRKQFRATMGTLFEGSHVPLHKWFQACFLLEASNNAISAHRLHLRLEVTNRTASSMLHRLDPAMNGVGLGAGLGGAGWIGTLGRLRAHRRRIPPAGRSPAGGNAGAEGVFASDDLSWTNSSTNSAAGSPPAPTRQFLGFLETARALDCPDDAVGFDEVLTRVGRHEAAALAS
jgi:hypothetical protein